MKRYRGVLIFLGLALLALSGAVYYYDHMLGYLCLAAAAFVTLIVLLLLVGVAKRQQQLMDSVFADNRQAGIGDGWQAESNHGIIQADRTTQVKRAQHIGADIPLDNKTVLVRRRQVGIVFIDATTREECTEEEGIEV